MTKNTSKSRSFSEVNGVGSYFLSWKDIGPYFIEVNNGSHMTVDEYVYENQIIERLQGDW